jgi:hypothetical protein
VFVQRQRLRGPCGWGHRLLHVHRAVSIRELQVLSCWKPQLPGQVGFGADTALVLQLLLACLQACKVLLLLVWHAQFEAELAEPACNDLGCGWSTDDSVVVST